jgi:hypothetical protein
MRLLEQVVKSFILIVALLLAVVIVWLPVVMFDSLWGLALVPVVFIFVQVLDWALQDSIW